MKNAYTVKKMYIDRGQNLLSDNYDYYKNLCCRVRISDIYHKYIGNTSDENIIICDKAGVGADMLIQTTGGETEDCCFVFCGPAAEGVCAGYFPEKNLFICNDLWDIYTDYRRIDMKNRYYRLPRRKYSPGQYRDMAKEYFLKAENIDIANKL